MKPLVRAAILGLFTALFGCAPAFHVGSMPGEPPGQNFANLGGARIRYVDRGKGPAVVLLHGFASALETWETVMPELSSSHRVIALDLKGFGWSDRPDGDYSPRAQAALVWALLEQRGLSRVSIVGHSWGASVAIEMTLARPASVEKLALYAAWVYEDQLPSTFHFARSDVVGEALFGLFYRERSDEKIAQAFYDENNVSERLVEDVERALERPGTTAAALAAVRGQRYAEIEGRYPEIQQPTLLLWGREDRVTPLRFGERLAHDLPNSELKVYARCGHFPMLEAKSASTRDLVAFLSKRS